MCWCNSLTYSSVYLPVRGKDRPGYFLPSSLLCYRAQLSNVKIREVVFMMAFMILAVLQLVVFFFLGNGFGGRNVEEIISRG